MADRDGEDVRLAGRELGPPVHLLDAPPDPRPRPRLSDEGRQPEGDGVGDDADPALAKDVGWTPLPVGAPRRDTLRKSSAHRCLQALRPFIHTDVEEDPPFGTHHAGRDQPVTLAHGRPLQVVNGDGAVS